MTSIIKGFILNQVKYKENDLIINVLTQNKIESFKVLGGLKVPNKYMNCIELYTFGEYEVYTIKDSDKYILRNGKTIEKLDTFSDFNKSILLSFLAESIIKDPDLKNQFEIFKNTFDLLKSNYSLFNIVAVVLKYHLIDNGSYLESDGCCKCGSKKSMITVNFNDGGFICNECNKIYNLPIRSNNYLLAYRTIMKATINDTNKFSYDDEVIKELISDMFYILEENIGIKLKSKEILLNI